MIRKFKSGKWLRIKLNIQIVIYKKCTVNIFHQPFDINLESINKKMRLNKLSNYTMKMFLQSQPDPRQLIAFDIGAKHTGCAISCMNLKKPYVHLYWRKKVSKIDQDKQQELRWSQPLLPQTRDINPQNHQGKQTYSRNHRNTWESGRTRVLRVQPCGKFLY